MIENITRYIETGEPPLKAALKGAKQIGFTRLMEERPVAFYCDFHSHSRKHNIFIYGCEDKEMSELPLIEQVFPLMMHKASNGKVYLIFWIVKVFYINYAYAQFFSLISKTVNLSCNGPRRELVVLSWKG